MVFYKILSPVMLNITYWNTEIIVFICFHDHSIDIWDVYYGMFLLLGSKYDDNSLSPISMRGLSWEKTMMAKVDWAYKVTNQIKRIACTRTTSIWELREFSIKRKKWCNALVSTYWDNTLPNRCLSASVNPGCPQSCRIDKDISLPKGCVRNRVPVVP